MAVKVVYEKVHDDNFNKKMSDYWDKLNNEYRDKKYNDLNRRDVTSDDQNGIVAEDHETGDFILSSVDHYLDSLDYKIQYDFEDNTEELMKISANAHFDNKVDDDQKYNGFERATKQITRHLSFIDPKKGKDGDYKINLLIEIWVRSVISELGNLDNSNHKQTKCKVLILSNIKSLPFNDLEEEYNEVVSLVYNSIKKMKKEKYWEVEEKNTFSLEDISYIKPKEQVQQVINVKSKSKGKPKRNRVKKSTNKRRSKIK